MTASQAVVRRAYLALGGAGLLWGSAFYFAKTAEPWLGVGHMMVLRFWLASIGFLPILFRGIPAFTRREWTTLLLAAGIGVPVQFLVQFEGLARTTVSHASLMIGTAPVLIALAARIFLHERLRPLAWAALGASTVGVLLLLSGSTGGGAGTATLTGDLLVLASMLGGVAWVLMNKQLMARHSSTAISAVMTVAGTIMLTLWVVPREGLPPFHLPATVWGALLVLGLLTTTVTTLAWNYGLRHVNAGKAGIFINLEPVVGSLLGVFLLGDLLGPAALVGGLLIVLAAVVVSRDDAPTTPPPAH